MTIIQLPVPLYQGTGVLLQATFVTPVAGQPTSAWPVTDPTAVTLSVLNGNDAETTYTYNSGDGVIVKISTGVYQAEISTSAAPNLWRIKWTGTGTVPVVNFASFTVTPPVF